MPYYESSRVTLFAAETIARASFVKLEADGLKVCGAADTPIGFTELGAQDAGEHVCVRLINSQGTFEARSTGSIAIGSLVMLAEGGAVAPHSDGAGGQWRFSPDRAHFRPLRCRRGVTRGQHAYY